MTSSLVISCWIQTAESVASITLRTIDMVWLQRLHHVPCFLSYSIWALEEQKSHVNRTQRFQKRYQDALTLLNFASIICELLLRRGGSFLFEQPWNALSWKESCLQTLLRDPRCELVRTDQCMFQQKDAHGNLLKKSTGFLTNNKYVAKCLRRACNRRHLHGRCVGSIPRKIRSSWCSQIH